MKLLICILIASIVQTGCNSTRPAGGAADTGKRDAGPAAQSHAATARTASADKVFALLLQSKKMATTPGIDLLIKKLEENIYLAEPLYDLAYAHLDRAQATKNVAELNLAAQYFNELLLRVPGNQGVVAALYNIYYDDILQGRNADSLAKARALLAQMPESVQATMNAPSLAKFIATARRQQALRQSDRQTLREILLEAIQEQPRNDHAYMLLAKMYSDDRYFSLAIATLHLAAETIADSAELYQAIASTYEKRAAIHNCNYEHPGDIAKAAKFYKLAIPLAPENQQLHYNLANALIDQQQIFLGLNESDIALELGATGTTLSITAQDYSILGYTRKASELLQLALDKGLDIGDPSYHEINMNQGNWQQAANGFAAYIKQQNSFTVYDFIKSEIIAQQAQQQPLLTQDRLTLGSQWEENLLNYWNATVSDETLKNMAHNRCERTEYYFYTGYKDLRNGQTAQANSKFTIALQQNTSRFIERPLAQYFLRAMSPAGN